MSENRFLLILASGTGFWQDMHHVLGQLLKAELTNRIPVVFWSKNSLYGIEEGENAFEHFFLPVSGYTLNDLEGRDVIVHDQDAGMEEAAQLLEPGHPFYGLGMHDLYSMMIKKYIRLQPDIKREIDLFYQEEMSGKPVIGVHIRGSDKISEVSHLHRLNEGYPTEIENYLKKSPEARIFLMTDCGDILSDYKKVYGHHLIHTDSRRVLKYGAGVHFQDYPDKKRKGIEVIKDTWLAAKCDYFIGNGYSNVSRAVSELRGWPDGSIRLLY